MDGSKPTLRPITVKFQTIEKKKKILKLLEGKNRRHRWDQESQGKQ